MRTLAASATAALVLVSGLSGCTVARLGDPLPSASGGAPGPVAPSGAVTSDDPTASGHVDCDGRTPAGSVLGTDGGGLLVPAPVTGSPVQVVGGDGRYLALLGDGGVLAWSDEEPVPRPVPAPDGASGPLVDIVQVAADSRTAAARTRDGGVVVWGDQTAGQAGDGSSEQTPWPRPVRTADGQVLRGTSDLAVDGRTLAAVGADGRVLVWGDVRHGQLGDGGATGRAATATEVHGPDGRPLTDVVDVAVGGQHVVVATAAGEVLTWGSDSRGQLGTAGEATTGVPSVVAVPAPVVAVAANELDSYAVTDDGRVLAWGEDESGQTGTGGTGGQVRGPTVVPGLTDVACVEAGEAFAVALHRSGEVSTWGAGGKGQLAAGDEVQRRTPGAAFGPDGEPVRDALWVGTSERSLFVGVPGEGDG